VTARKHLKQLVRARMLKTGESYATARRRIIGEDRQPETDPAARWHFPGNVPGATALRVLLAQAGVRDPQTGEPFSESMLFGIAGGIGIGVFSFHYEKEDFSSFFIGGRHKWQDDQGYLTTALKLFGITPVVNETAGPGLAAQQLSAALDRYGACVAWVDMAHLPHRALPSWWSGGGYHIVTVYKVKPEESIALIGDLTDDPVSIPLADLTTARDRIKKQKNRILAVPTQAMAGDLSSLVKQGLANCLREFEQPSMKGARSNFQLQAIRTWGERMHGSKEKESWDRVFRRGGPLWTGLTSVHSYIEYYGTGGGLCRPLFADFLREASEVHPRLQPLGERYTELGLAWSALADAALPDDVPLMKEAKEVLARRSELTLSGGPVEEIRQAWSRMDELEAAAKEAFPISEAECDELRAGLKKQILALYEAEVAALAALRRTISQMG
jgi:hypothetical protein